MSIKIRRAKQQDFHEIYGLIMEFAEFLKTPEKVKTTPEQLIRDKQIFNCMVAEANGSMVGFATFFFSYYSWSGKAIYLDDLYTKVENRGHGIGNLLFEAVRKIGVEENCHTMKWQVSRWNKDAQEFYKRKGASIDDVEINCEQTLI